MSLRILASAAAISLAFAAAAAPAGAEPLALADLPDLVLASDTGAVTAAQSVQAAYHAYRGMLADALPQVDLSTGYSLYYTPEITMTDPIVDLTEYARHGATAKLTASQLLPTAGNLLRLRGGFTQRGVDRFKLDFSRRLLPIPTSSRRRRRPSRSASRCS